VTEENQRRNTITDHEAEPEGDLEAVVSDDAVDLEEAPEEEIAAVLEEIEKVAELEHINFEIGDWVVYPHHGAGTVIKKEDKNVLGEIRQYLTIKILHNDMTVMVPTANAAQAGLRRVIDEETCQKVIAVLQAECSAMSTNWNRRFKANREKIKTGNVYDLAEVIRNLGVRDARKGLSTGEKQMYTRAKKVLASEMMYALGMEEDEVDNHLTDLIVDAANAHSVAVASE
jgi:CarD family transcriptional regulator